MPMIFIRHVGANLAYVEPLGAVDPGFGVGHPGGADPGFDHPLWGRPDNTLPGGGHISNRPPMNPNFPNNSLPSGPPTTIHPGEVLVLVRDAVGVWHYHALAPGSPPPRPVPPGPPDHISGQPIAPPPGTTAPPTYPTGGPVPPPGTVAPKR